MMRTFPDFQDALAEVSYNRHSGQPWRFRIGGAIEAPWLQVVFEAKDSTTGLPSIESGRKWRLSRHMTRSEVVQTALAAVLAAEEHEAREHFLYRGRPIFGPHFDVDALAELVDEGRQDVRSDPTASVLVHHHYPPGRAALVADGLMEALADQARRTKEARA